MVVKGRRTVIGQPVQCPNCKAMCIVKLDRRDPEGEIDRLIALYYSGKCSNCNGILELGYYSSKRGGKDV